MRIDMNCDMGECCTAGTESLEERIMPFVSSVNIACGVHGGDADTMRRIAAQALRSGCSIGAHPGFKDRDGSGRNELAIHPHAVINVVAYQIGALIGILSLDGARLNHVKPKRLECSMLLISLRPNVSSLSNYLAHGPDGPNLDRPPINQVGYGVRSPADERRGHGPETVDSGRHHRASGDDSD
jgi:hypothetical protein